MEAVFVVSNRPIPAPPTNTCSFSCFCIRNFPIAPSIGSLVRFIPVICLLQEHAVSLGKTSTKLRESKLQSRPVGRIILLLIYHQ